jgi:hypothetical protein
VTIAWGSMDGADKFQLLGTDGGSWVPVGTNGSVGDIPQDTTTYYLQYRGYTGEGTWFMLEGPITVDPIDCGECDPTLSNPSGTNDACIAKYPGGGRSCCNINVCNACGGGTHMACNNRNRCVSVSGGGNDRCSSDTDCVAPVAVGDLNIKIRLNGVEITTPTNVNFDITGPKTININSAPQNLSDVAIGTYNLIYNSGGPENSTFLGFSPGQSILISKNQTLAVYLDFTDGAGRCNITVQATKYSCDGLSSSPWTGALSYGLLGPIILNGTAVDQTFENIPAGRYYLTSLVGGPGTYNGVTPGNPVSCPSGGNVNVMMKFRDCGGSTSYKCNYSTGRCDLCDSSSSDCKYDSLSTCNMQCSGCTTNHDPKASVFCWANFDSDTCEGVNDNNANTPSIILYDKSTDSCGDPRTCVWHIESISGGIKNIPDVNACAPYPWYDETPGTYKATLTVTDSQGKSSIDTQNFTIKNVDALTCNFAWDPDAPTVSGATSFFDQTLTPNGTTLKSWAWTFPGATPASSTAQTVSNVVFNSAGTKNVTLTVKNSANKTCTISKEITVKTINPYWKEVVPF